MKAKGLTANELMIGDWLHYYDDDESQNIPVKIVSIDDDGWCFFEFPDGMRQEGWCRNLYPIPLTPEILEKNGFKDISDHTLKGAETFRLTMGDGNIQLTYKLGDYFAYDYHDDRWYRQYQTNLCHGWCVHNLQHALKDCGIDKEITL